MTVAFDRPEFKIWTYDKMKCDVDHKLLHPHIMISTSFKDGINYILESSPDQLVCVDTNKSLKFYDFKHESEKEQAQKTDATREKLEADITKGFETADLDKVGRLEFEEI